MGNKWIKVLLQLVIGLLVLWYGVTVWEEAFSWLAWWCTLLGGTAAIFAVEKIVGMLDPYERWKV